MLKTVSRVLDEQGFEVVELLDEQAYRQAIMFHIDSYGPNVEPRRSTTEVYFARAMAFPSEKKRTASKAIWSLMATRATQSI